jgi:hypothetical protein
MFNALGKKPCMVSSVRRMKSGEMHFKTDAAGMFKTDAADIFVS